jgi:CheY-like chemotaxis protein
MAAGTGLGDRVGRLHPLEKLDCLERPCIVIFDLMMPRMSGLDFLAHLSDSPNADGVSVLVMSAHDRLGRDPSPRLPTA